MTRLRWIAVFSGIWILASCTSTVRIHSAVAPGADFQHYKTFAFEPRLGTDREDGSTTMLSSHLKQTTRIEMECRGYFYDESEPDLRVNFYLHTKKKVQSVSVPAAPVGYGYYGYRQGYYSAWGGYETQVTEYTEGTLHLDLIDTKKKQLVWEGVAVGHIQQSDLENLDQRVTTVVDNVFERFPFRGAGAPPLLQQP